MYLAATMPKSQLNKQTSLFFAKNSIVFKISCSNSSIQRHKYIKHFASVCILQQKKQLCKIVLDNTIHRLDAKQNEITKWNDAHLTVH